MAVKGGRRRVLERTYGDHELWWSAVAEAHELQLGFPPVVGHLNHPGLTGLHSVADDQHHIADLEVLGCSRRTPHA